MQDAFCFFWFRRDLRLEDNAGLYAALKSGHRVIPVFIFDEHILDRLEDRSDARVQFIHQSLERLKAQLRSLNSDLMVFHGKPIEIWSKLLEEYNPSAVYTNRDYEPYALKRDQQVKALLEQNKIEWHTRKDHLIFEADEVTKADGSPYVVFTPYKRKWLEKLSSRGVEAASYYFKSYPSLQYSTQLYPFEFDSFPTLKDLGFQPTVIKFPRHEIKQSIVKAYDKRRDFPAIEGTTKLGVHFRFGTISIREKARKAIQLNATYLSELIWRDFYSSIMQAYPRVVDGAFREKYEAIEWRNNEQEFELWCQGKTGYPIVDAGMRELNATGYMHNRVRMITASFLTKHLLIDWRWGEAYFAQKLLDFDLASNNGGWQWAAGCGTDAAPYFRVFNPYTQQSKFDKQFEYIKKWVPEYGTADYPEAMVDHKSARIRCLDTYKSALN